MVKMRAHLLYCLNVKNYKKDQVLDLVTTIPIVHKNIFVQELKLQLYARSNQDSRRKPKKILVRGIMI